MDQCRAIDCSAPSSPRVINLRVLVRLGLVELVDYPTHRPGKVARLTAAGRVATRGRLREVLVQAVADRAQSG